MHGALDPTTSLRAATRLAPAMSVRGLTVAYDTTPVLWNVDVELRPGVMMAIVGPNGAGKTTLLMAALGMLPRLSGEIRFFGESLRSQRLRVAYVPQRRSVDWEFPTTVLDLVLMGTYGRLGWFRRPGADERRKAQEALEMVEMADLRDRQISELSGGQQQRIFLARAFVQHADLYLMDEPFAGVDAKTERTLVRVLRDLRGRGKTMLVVHHDLTTVADYFDEVTLVNRRVAASGPVATAFTAEHIEAAYGGAVRLHPRPFGACSNP